MKLYRAFYMPAVAGNCRVKFIEAKAKVSVKKYGTGVKKEIHAG